jgi:serine/threonine protein kinase
MFHFPCQITKHTTKLIHITRIITYVLLCGYSPFRSEDTKDLIRETTEAKIEFHDRYWKNVSEQAKGFIRSLLKPDPAGRPTAEEASKHPVRFYNLIILRLILMQTWWGFS